MKQVTAERDVGPSILTVVGRGLPVTFVMPKNVNSKKYSWQYGGRDIEKPYTS